jgi:hypothetical protein
MVKDLSEDDQQASNSLPVPKVLAGAGIVKQNGLVAVCAFDQGGTMLGVEVVVLMSGPV